MRRAVRHHSRRDLACRYRSSASVTLPYEERHRRRVRLIDDTGEPFLLDLEHAVMLGHGDGLELEGGGFIAVRAADEAVYDIRCHDAAHTARVAWHIGNRHAPVQVLGTAACASSMTMCSRTCCSGWAPR